MKVYFNLNYNFILIIYNIGCGIILIDQIIIINKIISTKIKILFIMIIVKGISLYRYTTSEYLLVYYYINNMINNKLYIVYF